MDEGFYLELSLISQSFESRDPHLKLLTKYICNISFFWVCIFNHIYDVCFQITDEGRNVFAIEVPEDQLDEVSRSMYSHLRTLINERDGYVEVCAFIPL